MAVPDPQRSLIPALQTILRDLSTSPYPTLELPEGCKKRASVAFIIRVQPTFAHWPTDSSHKHEDLGSYFSEEWVQYGEPEVLFIKRAARKGDRWTSHIALPGGRRDPEDLDDQAAAVRETWEEVGLDLKTYGLPCGNLPQRIVTTHWGKKPLLVLSPYIFLLTSHDTPPLRLQPTEVASTHWVPLRSLLNPAERTVAFEDVASRVAQQETGVRKWMAGAILGKMVFAAINLTPTESVYSAESPSETSTLQDNRHVQKSIHTSMDAFLRRVWLSDILNQFSLPPRDGPLLLWGLTLGAVSDFLDLIPPHNALTLWTYPTFTPLDVRFTIWLMTYRFKNRKRAELQAGTEFLTSARPSFGGASESGIAHRHDKHNTSSSEDNATTTSTDISESTVIVSNKESSSKELRTDETGFHGLGTGAGAGAVQHRQAAVQTMLEGYVYRLLSRIASVLRRCDALGIFSEGDFADRRRYYEILRRAVAVALIGRAGVVATLAWMAWSRWKSRTA